MDNYDEFNEELDGKIQEISDRFGKEVDEMRKRSLEDAREWPPPDSILKRFEHMGLDCAVVQGPICLCGYVHVPFNHPDAKKLEDGIDGIEVHGGLTFRCKAIDGGAWFGFDCGHYNDEISEIPLPELPEAMRECLSEFGMGK